MKVRISREIKQKINDVEIFKIKEEVRELYMSDQFEEVVYDEFLSNENLVKITFELVKKS